MRRRCTVPGDAMPASMVTLGTLGDLAFASQPNRYDPMFEKEFRVGSVEEI